VKDTPEGVGREDEGSQWARGKKPPCREARERTRERGRFKEMGERVELSSRGMSTRKGTRTRKEGRLSIRQIE